VDAAKQHDSCDRSWDPNPMAEHRVSPSLAGIDSLAFRQLKNTHAFAHNRALQKGFLCKGAAPATIPKRFPGGAEEVID
jgi:hypothetical protein